ncbi:hypothetical protein SCHPADRAFT_957469 [Schizopora paradoxa]|uniref:Protein BNI4 n=1 Tax=Schizopora paradoxa TaxID=27342 RepID=A0A0H2S0S7_9AGAM|nr:hypothetical protein SCHPADRAFT_957469 [Schizopora paradoxa]
MALVAAQDWPKNDMDSRQQRTHSSSPHHDNQQQPGSTSIPYPSPPQQPQLQGQNPYPPYGQPPWSAMNMNMANMAAMNHINGHAHQPSPNYFPPMPFYPQNYPHMQQQPPVGVQQQPAFGNAPYFDPNAQFAQWAYQRMMFNAQAQQQLPGPPIPPPQQQQSQSQQSSQSQNRGRSSSHSHSTHSPVSTPTEYISTAQLPFSHSNGSVASATNSSGTGNSNRFPQAPSQPPQPGPPSNNYQGFHPYRRPDRAERQRSYDTTTPSPPQSNMNSVPFAPPYARQDAAGSTTSVNSTSNSSQRSRTNSTNSASGGSIRGQERSATPSTTGSVRGVSSPYPNAHPSRISSSSSTASAPTVARTSSAPGTSGSGGVVSASTSSMNSRTARPSPLSQGSTYSSSSSAAERRKSRDDSDLAAMLSSQSLGSLGMEGTASGSGHGPRSGLKGRLRRALSFNAVQTLKEEEDEDATVAIGKSKKKERVATISGAETDDGDDGETSTATMKKKKSLRIFNSRFNASTDNISLSSTVSSASVMIRKLGSMGRLARRNSLAGITSLFKDKNKEGDAEGSKSGKKSKAKAGKAEVSVSHVTAETDRSSSEWSAPGMEGLSPAATLARQHTLRSNAEAAARAKAQQEAQAAAAAAAEAASASSSSQVAAWDRNTSTRHGQSGSNGSVREDGMRLVVEEDSDEDVMLRRPSSDSAPHHEEGEGSDEESTWRGHGDEDEDEDVTIRIGMDRNAIDDVRSSSGHGEEEEEIEPWAVDVRRSVERTRVPSKGILKSKYSESYSQEVYIEGPNPPFAQNRVRANSYDSVPNQNSQAGPFARIPSPNPDHIDGLHKHHGANGPTQTTPPSLPPLSFESSDSDTLLSSASPSPPVPEKQAFFNHPNMNSSEPALSTMMASPPTLTHRSATTPAKRLAFATNLSIYDTFPAQVYDRRSEPATWSRLTPALAQRIKEELNSFKMEEMEVHHASRVHTQFFV